MGLPQNSTIPDELVDQLKAQHGKLAWRKFQGYEFLFRPMTVGEYERFKARSQKSTDSTNVVENLCAEHVVYPTGSALEAIYEDMPALKAVIGSAILKRAGVTLEAEEGEV